MIKVNIWKISGCKGYVNPDDIDKDNFSTEIAMDACFSQKLVEDIYFKTFEKRDRLLTIKAEYIKTITV